jgi:hypothetical protein
MNSQPFGEISLSPLPGSAFLAHVSAEACEQLAARFAGYASTGHQAQILECRGGQRTQLGHFVAPILSAAALRLIGHLSLPWRPVASRQPMNCQASGRRLDVDLRCDDVPLYRREKSAFAPAMPARPTVCVLAFIAAGRGPAPPKRLGQELDRPSLVPAGVDPEECCYEYGSEEDLLFGFSFGPPGEPPSPSLHTLRSLIRCRHVPKGQPSLVVEKRNRSSPPEVRCGGPDGLIRRCDDGEED